MTGCKKIDMDTWARREHYEYYTKQLKVEYNITANVDVKNVLDFCHSKGYKFYPAMIYLVTKTLNRIDNFKMFKDKYGYLCAWDKIIPNYTIFHNDDHTFSDCWTDFSEDFKLYFYNKLLRYVRVNTFFKKICHFYVPGQISLSRHIFTDLIHIISHFHHIIF